MIFNNSENRTLKFINFFSISSKEIEANSAAADGVGALKSDAKSATLN